MAEMADAILNGDFDSITGEWLGNGYGIPRTRQNTGREKNNWANIKNYLKRYDSIKKNSDCVEVVLKYAVHLKSKEKDIQKLSAIIQGNFKRFSNWCRSNIQ